MGKEKKKRDVFCLCQCCLTNCVVIVHIKPKRVSGFELMEMKLEVKYTKADPSVDTDLYTHFSADVKPRMTFCL